MTHDVLLFIIVLLAIIAGMSIGSFVALLWCEQLLLNISKMLSVEFVSKHLSNLNKLINHMGDEEESTDD